MRLGVMSAVVCVVVCAVSRACQERACVAFLLFVRRHRVGCQGDSISMDSSRRSKRSCYPVDLSWTNINILSCHWIIPSTTLRRQHSSKRMNLLDGVLAHSRPISARPFFSFSFLRWYWPKGSSLICARVIILATPSSSVTHLGLTHVSGSNSQFLLCKTRESHDAYCCSNQKSLYVGPDSDQIKLTHGQSLRVHPLLLPSSRVLRRPSFCSLMKHILAVNIDVPSQTATS